MKKVIVKIFAIGILSLCMTGCSDKREANEVPETEVEEKITETPAATAVPTITPELVEEKNGEFPESRIGFYSNGYWGMDLKTVDNSTKTITYDGYEFAWGTEATWQDGTGTIIDENTLEIYGVQIVWDGDAFTLKEGTDAAIFGTQAGANHDYEHGAGVYVRSDKPQEDDGETGYYTNTPDYILPDSSTRVIDSSEIGDFSIKDMQMAINEIYARHGRKFQDQDIQAYFDTKGWYSGTVDPDVFDEDVLSEVEQENIEILSYWMQPELSHSDPTSVDKYDYNVYSSESSSTSSMGPYGSYSDSAGNSITITESYGYNDSDIYYIGLADVSLITGTAYTVCITELVDNSYYQLVSANGTKVVALAYPAEGGLSLEFSDTPEAGGWYNKE